MTVAQTALQAMQVRIVEPQTLLTRMNELSEEIARRAYEIFEGNGRRFGHDLEDWFKAESEILPPFDLLIKEESDSLTVDANVAGFRAKELAVSLEPWRLTISGEKETKEDKKARKTTYQEQHSDQLLRIIDLPAEVDTAKAAATLKNEVLEVSIPKASKAATKGVEVKAA